VTGNTGERPACEDALNGITRKELSKARKDGRHLTTLRRNGVFKRSSIMATQSIPFSQYGTRGAHQRLVPPPEGASTGSVSSRIVEALLSMSNPSTPYLFLAACCIVYCVGAFCHLTARVHAIAASFYPD
jgi:hypothetical protein